MVPTCCIKCKKNLKMHITTAFNVPNVYNKTSFLLYLVMSIFYMGDTIIKVYYPYMDRFVFSCIQKFAVRKNISKLTVHGENMIYYMNEHTSIHTIEIFLKWKWKRTLRNKIYQKEKMFIIKYLLVTHEVYIGFEMQLTFMHDVAFKINYFLNAGNSCNRIEEFPFIILCSWA